MAKIKETADSKDAASEGVQLDDSSEAAIGNDFHGDLNPEASELVQPKDPMSYTEKELEAMRIDKKCAVQYRDIMKFRKKVMREKKAEGIEKNAFPPGEVIDRLRKDNPKQYAALVKTMGKACKEQLQHNLSTSTPYPPDTVRDWRMTIRAIERGLWHPKTPQLRAWRPPKTKTAYDRFMSS